MAMAKANELFEQRQKRVRWAIRQKAVDRPRLSVFRSANGTTVAAASTLDKELKGKLKTGANLDAAKEVGKLIASRAVAKGIKNVAFDRGGYKYHGRIKALADAAREGGLAF
jgi:large subunit ribosomal protein L18